MAALLREISDTGVELEIAVVLEGLRQADELRAGQGRAGVLSTATRARNGTPPGTTTEKGWCRARTAQSRHCSLSYLLLGDLFLQGLQLPVLFLVDKDPSVFDV